MIVQLGARKYYTGIVDPAARPAAAFRPDQTGRADRGRGTVATAEQLRLWHWLSEYYMCPLGMVLRAALPAGLKSDGFSEDETFGRGYMQPRQTVVSLHPDIRNEERLHVALDSLSRAKSQYKALLEYLEKPGIPTSAHRSKFRANGFRLRPRSSKRWPKKDLSGSPIPKSRHRTRPPRQTNCPNFRQRKRRPTSGSKPVFRRKEVVLLHGVTGSGKTEIYIRLMAEALAARAQRAVHAARNRVDRTTDPAHGKLFRKSRHGLPFAAERQPPSLPFYHELLRCDGRTDS